MTPPRPLVSACCAAWILASAVPASADWDLTLLAGMAFPTYDERLTVRVPSIGSVPGLVVSADRDLVLRADGGLTFGGALAWEFAGIVALEARVDTAEVQFETDGVEYALSIDGGGAIPPISATLTVGAGAFDLERLTVVSGNLRVRTPGAISLFASGGASYLLKLEAKNAVPLQLRFPGLPAVPPIDGALALVAEPDEGESRFGFNAGGGLRLGLGGPVALVAEARLFVFKQYELRLDAEASDAGLRFIGELADRLPAVRFDPILYSVSGGLVFSF
jgi:hypothetical protein